MDDSGKDAFLNDFKEQSFHMDVHQILLDVFKIEKKRLVGYKSQHAHIMLHYWL